MSESCLGVDRQKRGSCTQCAHWTSQHFYRIPLCKNECFVTKFKHSSQYGFLHDFLSYEKFLHQITPQQLSLCPSLSSNLLENFSTPWEKFIPQNKLEWFSTDASCFLHFVFQNCCLIRCVGARAGTEFSKSVDQTHMCFFVVCYPPYWFSPKCHIVAFKKCDFLLFVAKKQFFAVLLHLWATVLSFMHCFVHQILTTTECRSSCKADAQKGAISVHGKRFTVACCLFVLE